MNNTEEDVMRHLSKGKNRAIDPDLDERTPLLASGSGVHNDVESTTRRRRLFPTLLTVFFFSLSFCALLFIVVAILAYSLGSSASGATPEELIQRALVVRGPDRVNVLKITPEGGIWLQVKGRIGIDAGKAMGYNTEEGDGILRDLWKSLGRWGVHQVDRVSVNLTTIDITTEDNDHLVDLSLHPLDLPLTANPPRDDTWLSETSLPVYVLPTKNVTVLVGFLRESWRNGTMRVKANVGRAVVHAGSLHDGGWKSWLSVTRSHVKSEVRVRGVYLRPLLSCSKIDLRNILPSPAITRSSTSWS